MLESLSTELEADLMRDLKTSPTAGIGLDESNDRSFDIHCILIVHCVTPTAILNTYS